MISKASSDLWLTKTLYGTWTIETLLTADEDVVEKSFLEVNFEIIK